MKKIFSAKNITTLILFIFLGSIVYISVRLALAPNVDPASGYPVRLKSDYIIILFECVLGTVALLIPGFLRRIVRINIPAGMLIMYAVFLFCAVYLGEVRSFYTYIAHWDTILHTFSGAALGALGFSLVSLMNKSEAVAFSLSPVFVGLFSFCFALSLGVVWEIYEFGCDSILHTNMQRYVVDYGDGLTGNAALADTMKDLMVDAIGALAMSVVGFISLKYKKGWLERFRIKPMGKS